MGIPQDSINKTAKAYISGRLKRVARSVMVNVTAAGIYDLGELIPKDAIITKVLTDEVITLVGLTSVKFQAGDQDLTAAIALAAFTGVDSHALVADGVVVTARTTMKITTVGTATAGKVNVFYEYLMR